MLRWFPVRDEFVLCTRRIWPDLSRMIDGLRSKTLSTLLSFDLQNEEQLVIMEMLRNRYATYLLCQTIHFRCVLILKLLEQVSGQSCHILIR